MSTAVAEPRAAVRPACLYCGGRDLDTLYTGVRDRLGHVPGERTFLRCRACGSAVLDPLPRTDELPGFYPPVYTFSAGGHGGGLLRRAVAAAEYRLFFAPQYRAQVKAVTRACGSAGAGRTLLDVGCGHGLRLVEFRRLGFAVHGLDLQPEAVAYLRAELNVPAECGDVTALPRLYAPASFDVVTAFHLIEHVPDVEQLLADVATVLKPGGTLVAATPLVDAPQVRLFGKRWAGVTEAPRHVALASREGLRRACARAGFGDVSFFPDSALGCAGVVGLSVVSGSSVTRAYSGPLRGLLARLAGGAVTLAALPWCLFENHVLRRPPLGIIVTRKGD
ncbi:MAG: class I SAM-dependent methyltransferase [Gemmataceae bacterium]